MLGVIRAISSLPARLSFNKGDGMKIRTLKLTAQLTLVLFLLIGVDVFGQKPPITDKERSNYLSQELIRYNSQRPRKGEEDNGRRDVYDLIMSPQAKALKGQSHEVRSKYILDLRRRELGNSNGYQSRRYRSPIDYNILENRKYLGKQNNPSFSDSSLRVSTKGSVIHSTLGDMNKNSKNRSMNKNSKNRRGWVFAIPSAHKQSW
jgi:hypothetical protein